MDFAYCPRCGGALGTTLPQTCVSCGFVLYQNQYVTTSAIIVRDKAMLFTRRKVDPHQGMLDLPGGFVEPTEHPEAGMLRELVEELHVEGEIVRLLGVYGPDPYLYQGIIVYNCALHYLVTIGNQEPVAGDDAASYEWWPLDALPVTSDIAFPSQQKCLGEIKAGTLTL